MSCTHTCKNDIGTTYLEYLYKLNVKLTVIKRWKTYLPLYPLKGQAVGVAHTMTTCQNDRIRH